MNRQANRARPLRRVGLNRWIPPGLYAVVQAICSPRREQARARPCQLASGPGGCWSPGQRFHVNLAVATVTIVAVSITMSLAT